MLLKSLLSVAVCCMLGNPVFSQFATSVPFVPSNQFVPVSVNAPNFKYDKELSVGVAINNYGFYETIGFKNKNIIYLLSAQHNDGKTVFNPFNFTARNNEAWFLRSNAAELYYFEAALGYNFKLKGETFEGQNLDVIAGTGRDMTHENQRYFVQAGLSNDFRLINIGLSARFNYTTLKEANLPETPEISFATLDPAIQARIKIYDFRLVSQFGYCIMLKKHNDYMLPVFMAGIGYVFHKHERDQVKEVRQNYPFSY
jgi:hypothetical protein